MKYEYEIYRKFYRLSQHFDIYLKELTKSLDHMNLPITKFGIYNICPI